MKRTIPIAALVTAVLLVSCNKGSYMMARVNGMRWVQADESEMGTSGLPVVWAGLHDDGDITVVGENAGIVYWQSRFKALALIFLLRCRCGQIERAGLPSR